MTNMADEQDMPSKRRRWFQFSLRTLLLLIVAFSGVSYYLHGMVRQWKHPVRGRVFLDGKPVTGGFGRVTFELIDPETEQPIVAGGQVRKDGSYVLTTDLSKPSGGVVTGRYHVAVSIGLTWVWSTGAASGTYMHTMIPGKYTDVATSELRFIIPDDLTQGRLDLHLLSNGK